MLNRRKFVQGMVLSGLVGTRSGWAQRPLGGIKDEQKAFRFYNATILDAFGVVQKNWGGEVVDGQLVLSQSIADGIDLQGKWIVPNFIDAGCTVGLFEVGLESGTHDHSEAKESEQPLLRASDGYNPLSEVIPTIRANGIGNILVHPALNRLVAGSMSSLHTVGVTRAEAVQDARIGLCIGLGGAGKGHGGPSTRMGIANRIRELFSELSPSGSTETKWWKKEEKPAPKKGKEHLWQMVADGELPVLFSAHRADDIELALDIIQEFSIVGMLVGGGEAWLHADRIAAEKIPVLLGSITIQPNSFEHIHARYDNAKLLQEAGVQFAFRSGANHNSRWLPSEAAVAVAHGLPHAEAIKALCYNAGAFFPSVTPGFVLQQSTSGEANFFICDGDPLQPRNDIHRMWIKGKEVDLRTRQTDLYEQYKILD